MRRVLFELLRSAPDPIPVKQLAVRVRLPIPVLSALRRELESRSLLIRQSGASASSRGTSLLFELFGVTDIAGLPPVDAPVDEDILPTLRSWSTRRPEINGSLDQSRATVETAWRRSLFLIHSGAALGQRIAFLGDDDLSALTLLLTVRDLLGEDAAERITCTVFEIDERYREFMSEVAAVEGMDIEILPHDLRNPLPEEKFGRFDTFVTDPPYTFLGALCFLTRGFEGIPRDFGGQGFLSYSSKGTRDLAEIQNWFTGYGAAIRDILPAFNEYEGASILASSSDLYLLDIPPDMPIDELSRTFDEEIYTADYRTRQREYRCMECGHRVAVGPTEDFEDLNALRAQGCPECGHKRFKLFG